MTFPPSTREVYEQNPLKEVICQLRFPTILEISAENPARFQNKIRDAFPLYEVDQPSLPKELAEIVASLPISKPTTDSVTYKFFTADSDKLISLTTDFIAFADTDYIRWECFSEEIKRAQEALEEIYKPAFYTRVGLRYKNVIDRQELEIESKPWKDLLQPSLIGLMGAKDNIGMHVHEIRTEASIQLDDVSGGLATVRHGLGKTGHDNREVYFIDVDFNTAERTESQDVSNILAGFNRHSGDFFRWAITDELRDALGPRELEPKN